MAGTVLQARDGFRFTAVDFEPLEPLQGRTDSDPVESPFASRAERRGGGLAGDFVMVRMKKQSVSY